MLAACNGIIPLILVITTGGVAPCANVIEALDYKKLSKLVFGWTFPITMFYSLGRLTFTIEDVLVIVAYIVACLIDLPICMAFALFLDTRENFVGAVAHLWSSSSISNCIVVGIPIVAAMYGEENALKYCYLQAIAWGILLPLYYFMWELYRSQKEARAHKASASVVPPHERKRLSVSEETAISSAMEGTAVSLKSISAPAMGEFVHSSMSTLAHDALDSHLNRTIQINSHSPSKNKPEPDAPKQLGICNLILHTLNSTFRIPMVIGIIITIIYILIATFGYNPLRQLPAMIATWLKLLASLTTPLGALLLGAFITSMIDEQVANYKAGNMPSCKYWGMEMLRFTLISILKLFVMPLLFIGVARGFRISPYIIQINTIVSSSSTAVFCVAMADRYNYYKVSVGLSANVQILLMFACVPILYYICYAIFGDSQP